MSIKSFSTSDPVDCDSEGHVEITISKPSITELAQLIDANLFILIKESIVVGSYGRAPPPPKPSLLTWSVHGTVADVPPKGEECNLRGYITIVFHRGEVFAKTSVCDSIEDAMEQMYSLTSVRHAETITDELASIGIAIKPMTSELRVHLSALDNAIKWMGPSEELQRGWP